MPQATKEYIDFGMNYMSYILYILEYIKLVYPNIF